MEGQISIFDFAPSVMPVPEYRDCWRTCKNYLTNGSEACIYGSNQVGTGGEDVVLETINDTVKMFCRYYEEGQRDLEELDIDTVAMIIAAKTGYVFTKITKPKIDDCIYYMNRIRYKGVNIYTEICLERYDELCVYPELRGKRFIDLDVSARIPDNHCGSGRPTDSIPEAVDKIIELIEYHKKDIDKYRERGEQEEDNDV